MPQIKSNKGAKLLVSFCTSKSALAKIVAILIIIVVALGSSGLGYFMLTQLNMPTSTPMPVPESTPSAAPTSQPI